MATVAEFEYNHNGWTDLFSTMDDTPKTALQNMYNQVVKYMKDVLAADGKSSTQAITNAATLADAVIEAMIAASNGPPDECKAILAVIVEMITVVSSSSFRTAKALSASDDLVFMMGDSKKLDIYGITEPFENQGSRKLVPYVTDSFAAACMSEVSSEFLSTKCPKSGICLTPEAPKFVLLRSNPTKRSGILLVRMPRLHNVSPYSETGIIFMQEVLIVPENMHMTYIEGLINIKAWCINRDLPIDPTVGFPVLLHAVYNTATVAKNIITANKIELKLMPVACDPTSKHIENNTEQTQDQDQPEGDAAEAELIAAASSADNCCSYPFFVKDLNVKVKGDKQGINTIVYYASTGEVETVTTKPAFLANLDLVKAAGKSSLSLIRKAFYGGDEFASRKAKKDGDQVKTEFDLINEVLSPEVPFTSIADVRYFINKTLKSPVSSENLTVLYTICNVSAFELYANMEASQYDIKVRRRGVPFMSVLACGAIGFHPSWAPILNCMFELNTAGVPKPSCGAILKMSTAVSQDHDWKPEPVGGFKPQMIVNLVLSGGKSWIKVPLQQRKALCDLYKINNRFEGSVCTTYAINKCPPIRKRDLCISMGVPETDSLTLLMYQESGSPDSIVQFAADSSNMNKMFAVDEPKKRSSAPRKRKAPASTDDATADTSAPVKKPRKPAAAKKPKTKEAKLEEYNKLKERMESLKNDIGMLDDDVDMEEPVGEEQKVAVPVPEPIAQTPTTEAPPPSSPKTVQSKLPLTGQVRHLKGTPAKPEPTLKQTTIGATHAAKPKPVRKPEHDISSDSDSDSEDEESATKVVASKTPVSTGAQQKQQTTLMAPPIYSSDEDDSADGNDESGDYIM